jgi:ADP-heptose:LPS heptosyltransferase
MGLGGYLTWTAVAEEIKKRMGDVSFLPVEQHGNLLKFVDSEIFKHNKNFLNSFCPTDTALPLILNNPAANYCKKDTQEKAYHRTDAHIIEQCCEVYGIKNPVLKCYLDFTEQENIEIQNIVDTHVGNKEFITIEPYSKDNYTVNRVYSFEKWQLIVDELSKDYIFVQVGNKGKTLNNVIDLTGKTSFLQATGIIGKSKLFMSAEGGLVHAATAVNTKSLVILTGYQSQKMVAYPQNTNINISNHGPCGLKKLCVECKQDVEKHDWQEVVRKARESL